MSDVQKKLSALLGREVKQVRKTDETPPRVSVVDVAAVITGKDHNAAAQDLRRMSEKYPEVNAKCIDFKFPGQGQRKTRITDARGMVSVIMLLPGRHAARVRRQAADLLVRYLGGDLALVDEVCMIHGFQEELAIARQKILVGFLEKLSTPPLLPPARRWPKYCLT